MEKKIIKTSEQAAKEKLEEQERSTCPECNNIKQNKEINFFNFSKVVTYRYECFVCGCVWDTNSYNTL